MTTAARRETLRRSLIAMAEADDALRSELVRCGELFDGYHPQMRRLHTDHARALSAILDEHGWPGTSLVGGDGERAAWLVLQHAIGDPDVMRRGVDLLESAVAAGEAPADQWAMLTDRVRVLEGRSQRFGTQLDWDDQGRLAPLPIEDPDAVDDRRTRTGLEPLADAVARVRERTLAEGGTPPADVAARRREQEAWAREVGWHA